MKNENYTCFFNNNCLINKFSHNRCKACRFKKCQKEGMSINENDLERIRKIVLEKAVLAQKENESDTEDELKRKSAPNLSTAIYLTLKINADQESMSYMNTFNVQNILNRHSTFRTANIVAKTSINENFIIYISLLKNKAYQIYKLNIENCELVSNIRNRTSTGDFIRPDQHVDEKTLLNLFVTAQSQVLTWLNVYAKQLPGFNKFDNEDFSNIIESSICLLLAVKVSEFVKEDENYTIFQNVQICKSRMSVLFGHSFADLILQFHKDFNQLELIENEMALLYPFVLTSCNRKHFLF